VETQCLHEIRRLIRELAEMSEWAQRVLADVLQERRNREVQRGSDRRL